MWLVINIANIFFLLGLGVLLYEVLGNGKKCGHSLHCFFRFLSKMTGALLILLATIFSVILVLQVFAFM